MFKSIFATLAAFTIAAPASATSWTDVQTLSNLISETGTSIQQIDCDPGVMGFYQYDGTIDRLVICKNHVDMNDPDAVWEVLVHEATHVMQACNAGPVIQDTYVPRVLRELQETAPHYYATLQNYRGDHKRVELEAFWMELRAPAVPIEWMQKYCYESTNG